MRLRYVITFSKDALDDGRFITGLWEILRDMDNGDVIVLRRADTGVEECLRNARREWGCIGIILYRRGLRGKRYFPPCHESVDCGERDKHVVRKIITALWGVNDDGVQVHIEASED